MSRHCPRCTDCQVLIAAGAFSIGAIAAGVCAFALHLAGLL